MRKERTLLLGPAPGRMTPAQALELLRPVQLPGLVKCLLTNAKFDTGKAAKTFNLAADYPPEPEQLQTFAAWSGLGAAEQLSDGLEIFALRAVIDRDGPFDFVILLRQAVDIEARWPDVLQELRDKPYICLGDEAFVLNLGAPGGSELLDALWDLHVTGAVYGLSDYNMASVLDVAAEAVRLRH